MTLDFNLISKAGKQSVNQLQERIPTISPDLFLLDNFLDPELLNKLLLYVTNNELKWSKETSKDGTINYANRFKINWDPDTVIEETNIIMENLTDTINQLYNRKTKFLGISVWKDLESYIIGKHIDNPIIDIALQIYLNDGPYDLATKFEHHGQTIHAQYNTNSGYIMDNRAKLVHYVGTAVPVTYTRYSLYAIWTNPLTSQ